MKKALAVAGLVLMAALAGCVGASEQQEHSESVSSDALSSEQISDRSSNPGGIHRVIDDKAGVVCYIYEDDQYEQGGISCMPKNETKLVSSGEY